LWLGAGEHRIERSFNGDWPIYREVWKAGVSYDIGDVTTFDGSMWVALEPNKDSKPGQFNKVWRLSVKKGRNGRS